MKPLLIADNFVALDDTNGARALNVDANFWESLEKGEFGDFSRLISYFEFESDWETWEIHPSGEEFVYLIEGEVELILESNGVTSDLVMDKANTFIIVPKGTWHTANVRKPSKCFLSRRAKGQRSGQDNPRSIRYLYANILLFRKKS